MSVLRTRGSRSTSSGSSTSAGRESVLGLIIAVARARRPGGGGGRASGKTGAAGGAEGPAVVGLAYIYWLVPNAPDATPIGTPKMLW